MKQIKILLVDDHVVVRNGIKLMLSQQKSFTPIITEANDAEEALEVAKNKNFGVILMDVSLPNMDGIAATKQLLLKNSEFKILALTMHNEEFTINQMIEAGALGYILKNTGVEELTNAINTVANGSPYYSNEVAQTLINRDTSKTTKVKAPPVLDTLTKREKEILKLVGAEMTSNAISEKLCISKRTVEVHRKNILKKLGFKKSSALYKFVVENANYI